MPATFLGGLAVWAFLVAAPVGPPGEAAPVLEAELIVRDLRQLVRDHERSRAVLSETRVGRAYYASEATSVILWHQLALVPALAKPSGAGVPCRISLLRHRGRLVVQAGIEVEPGLAERLAESRAQATPPSWRSQRRETTWTFSWGEQTWAGRLRQDGWLVIAPDEDAAALDSPSAHLSADLSAELADSSAYTYVSGNGEVAEILRGIARDPRLSTVSRAVEGVAIGMRIEEGSWRYRVVLDAPLLVKVGQLVGNPTPSPAPTWGDEVTSTVALDVPPHLAAGGLPLLLQQLRDTHHEMPADLAAALGRFTGRADLVAFGSPGDWALGLSFFSPGDAKAAVRALAPYLDRVLGGGAAGLGDLVVDEAGGSVLHLRPHAALEGWRIAAVGDHVLVVAQGQRLQSLEQPAATDSLLTPLVRATTERAALLKAYSVLGADGGWMAWGAWLARVVEVEVARLKLQQPELGELLAWVFDEATLGLAVLGVSSMLTYDVAGALRLSGGVLVLELARSEL
jgi:hypothetical protein